MANLSVLAQKKYIYKDRYIFKNFILKNKIFKNICIYIKKLPKINFFSCTIVNVYKLGRGV